MESTVNILRRFSMVLLTLSITAAITAGAWWLVTNRNPATQADKHSPPANIPTIVKEEELNVITLTEAAEKRIGLKVGKIEKKAVRRVRVYGGEVTIPVGRAILVAAPLGGILKASSGGMPSAGQSIKAGQQLFQLLPQLTPDGRATLSASLADADGQVNSAKAQIDLARIALERTKRVLKDGAGSQRQVDEAQGAFDLASRTMDAATARKTILAKVVGDVESGTAAPLSIDAPRDGILRNVSASAGQNVPSGAALFEVMDLSTVWVRVPIPVGDWDGIESTEAVRVGKLSLPSGEPPAEAKPVAAPPSANPLTGTVDVYYEMPNVGGKLIPGQRLGVTIPLSDEKESLTAPWSAVVFDAHGGTWIYEQIGPHRYLRRRIAIRYTIGPDAVLGPGPTVGVNVVVKGVPELFGAETGFAK